jgi:gliding motility-associatede transport system auxiliary component
MKKDNIIGITAVVLIVASLIWYSISQIWGVVNWILLVLGVGALGYYMFYYFKSRDKEISQRSVKKGSNVLVQIVITLAIISMIAFITTRRNFRVDWSENSLFSLADQSVKVLEGLNKPVDIKAFFRTSDRTGIKTRLDEYSYRSSNLTYEFIDPDQEPQIVKQYGIKQISTIVVESGIKRETVTELSEANITNAIIKVTREQDKVIYYTSGHGERSIEDTSPEGLKQSTDAIKKENHLVRQFNLAMRKSVPDSASVVAVVSPKTAFFPQELDSLEKYVTDGGKLLLLLDPESPQELRDFANRFKLKVGNDMVIDASGLGQLFGSGPGVPLVQTYDKENAITKGFGLMTFFPYTSSVSEMDEKDGWTVTQLAKTSGESWAETDYSTGEVSFDENKDTRGPITVAAVSQKGKSTVIIFGDSDFAKNGYFNQQGNGNLFLNTINYLAEDEDLISIRPKQPQDRRLTLTQADVSTIFYLVVIAIPLLLVILGVVIFIKRNRA